MEPNKFNPKTQKDILDHMNEDHLNALIHYCHLLGMTQITEKDTVVMTGIDQDGFDIKVNEENIRFPIDTIIKTLGDVRKVLVSLAKKPLNKEESV